MKNETMKPCPFCGSDDAEVCEGSPYASDPDRATYRVVCGFCGANPAGTWTVTEAKAMWNRRLTPLDDRRPPLPANVAEAVGHLEQFVEFIEGNSESSRLSKSCFRTILEYMKERP